MTHTTAPNREALAALFPGKDYYYLVHTLCRALPAPPTDSPEDLALRNDAAITEVAALCPANLAEAKVAVLHVACSEHALHCLHQAEHPGTSFLVAEKCRAQAASMTRQARGELNLLLRMQAARQRIEAKQETRDRAAWAEHCALNLMADALQAPSPCRSIEPRSGSEAEGSTPIAEPPAPPPAPQPQPEPVASLHLSRLADLGREADQEPALDSNQGLPWTGSWVAPRNTADQDAVAQPALRAPTRAAMNGLLRQFNAGDVDPLQAILATARDNPDTAGGVAPHLRNE